MTDHIGGFPEGLLWGGIFGAGTAIFFSELFFRNQFEGQSGIGLAGLGMSAVGATFGAVGGAIRGHHFEYEFSPRDTIATGGQ
jgi:hypothetical protein